MGGQPVDALAQRQTPGKDEQGTVDGGARDPVLASRDRSSSTPGQLTRFCLEAARCPALARQRLPELKGIQRRIGWTCFLSPHDAAYFLPRELAAYISRPCSRVLPKKPTFSCYLDLTVDVFAPCSRIGLLRDNDIRAGKSGFAIVWDAPDHDKKAEFEPSISSTSVRITAANRCVRRTRGDGAAEAGDSGVREGPTGHDRVRLICWRNPRTLQRIVQELELL
jgi:hypothetical protein